MKYFTMGVGSDFVDIKNLLIGKDSDFEGFKGKPIFWRFHSFMG